MFPMSQHKKLRVCAQITTPLDRSLKSAILSISTISMMVTIVNWYGISLSARVLADVPIHYSPPVDGTPRPERRDASGSRGTCNMPLKLKLIVPNDHIPLTVSASPTFLWYLSAVPQTPITFTLVDPAQVEPVLEEQISNPQKGINKLTVPQSTELIPGKQYLWSISIDCSKFHPSENLYASAWIERVSVPPKLKQELGTVKGRQRAMVYANSGIWYDATAEVYQGSLPSGKGEFTLSDFYQLLEQVGLFIPANLNQLQGFVGSAISVS